MVESSPRGDRPTIIHQAVALAVLEHDLFILSFIICRLASGDVTNIGALKNRASQCQVFAGQLDDAGGHHQIIVAAQKPACQLRHLDMGSDCGERWLANSEMVFPR